MYDSGVVMYDSGVVMYDSGVVMYDDSGVVMYNSGLVELWLRFGVVFIALDSLCECVWVGLRAQTAANLAVGTVLAEAGSVHAVVEVEAHSGVVPLVSALGAAVVTGLDGSLVVHPPLVELVHDDLLGGFHDLGVIEGDHGLGGLEGIEAGAGKELGELGGDSADHAIQMVLELASLALAARLELVHVAVLAGVLLVDALVVASGELLDGGLHAGDPDVHGALAVVVDLSGLEEHAALVHVDPGLGVDDGLSLPVLDDLSGAGILLDLLVEDLSKLLGSLLGPIFDFLLPLSELLGETLGVLSGVLIIDVLQLVVLLEVLVGLLLASLLSGNASALPGGLEGRDTSQLVGDALGLGELDALAAVGGAAEAVASAVEGASVLALVGVFHLLAGIGEVLLVLLPELLVAGLQVSLVLADLLFDLLAVVLSLVALEEGLEGLLDESVLGLGDAGKGLLVVVDHLLLAILHLVLVAGDAALAHVEALLESGQDLGVVAGKTALDALDGAVELELGGVELQGELGSEELVLGKIRGLGLGGGLLGGDQVFGVGLEGGSVGLIDGLLETFGLPLLVHPLDDLEQSFGQGLSHVLNEVLGGLVGAVGLLAILLGEVADVALLKVVGGGEPLLFGLEVDAVHAGVDLGLGDGDGLGRAGVGTGVVNGGGDGHDAREQDSNALHLF